MYLKRKFNEFQEPDPREASTVWAEVMKITPTKIQFPEFYDKILNVFNSEREMFNNIIHHSAKKEATTPSNFEELPPLTQISVFFSYFKTIFGMEELHNFALCINLSLEKIQQKFTRKQYIQYLTVVSILRRILRTMNILDQNKYSDKLAKSFARLLMPPNNKLFATLSIQFVTVFVSPCYLSNSQCKKIPAYIKLLSDGIFKIYSVDLTEVIEVLPLRKFTVIQDESILEFYEGSLSPILTLQFPNVRSAEIVLGIYISEAPIGFNHVTTFLSCISSLACVETFFLNIDFHFPEEAYTNISRIIESNGCEFLLYMMFLPTEEAKVNDKNALYFLSLIGNKLYPFIRCVIENNLNEVNSNHIVFRQNTALTSITTVLLKELGASFLANVVLKLNAIVNNTIGTFTNYELSDDESAINFAQNVFIPAFNVIINSVSYLPNSVKSIFREFFLGTINHFPNEITPLIVIANILLLRFIYPEFAAQNQKNMKFVSKISQAIMNTFYLHGWEADRNPPALVKLNEKYVYPLFNQIPQFLHDLITVDDNDAITRINCPNDMKVDIIKYIVPAAERFTSLNLESANFYVKKHIDIQSVTKMLHESVFELSNSYIEIVKSDIM